MSTVQLVQQAIKDGDKATARQLLRPLLTSSPTSEVYYLAARVASNREQAIKFLERTLYLDPEHTPAETMLEKLTAQASESPFSNDLLPAVLTLFNQYGWTITNQSADMIEVAKREGVSKRVAIALSLLLNVVGVVIVLALMLRSKTRKMVVQAQDTKSLFVKAGEYEKVVHSPYELTWFAQSANGVGYGKLAFIGAMSVSLWIAVAMLPTLLSSLGLNLASLGLPFF